MELQIGAGKAGSLILIIFSLHPWATISNFIRPNRYRKRIFLLIITPPRGVPGRIINRGLYHRPISLFLLLGRLNQAVSHEGA